MTKTEKAIIDSVKTKCKEFNSAFLSKLTIMACIKEHTTHDAQTVLKLMYEQRLIRYNRDTYEYRLARGLLDNYVAKDEKEHKELSIYLDYHADEILEKLTKVLAYQNRIEIAKFFNKYYVDLDLVGNTRRSSRDLFPDIKPKDVDLQYIRIWLYKLYTTCYKFSSAYKQLPEAYEEVAVSMTDRSVKKDGYYVLFRMAVSPYILEEHNDIEIEPCDCFLSLNHERYFDTLKKAEKFVEMLNNNNYQDNHYQNWGYTDITIIKASEADKANIAMSCSHLLPFEIEQSI